MSSPEVERFEVTEDDLANEFYPRSRGRMSKNKQIYGIWADNDSDDERPSFGRSRAKADLTAPVNFISGGVKQGDKIKKEGDVEDEEDSDSDSSTPVVQPPRTFSAGNQIKGRKGAGSKTFAGVPNSDKEFGGWERHTRGIGQKLLQKMGYEPGKGLGKTNQGITTPVEAVKRKGRAAVGAYGTERSERSLQDFPVYDSEEEEDKKFKDQLQQWRKKTDVNKKSKPKYIFKTAQEVIETGSNKRQKPVPARSKVKVIDMTGREQRVLSGYHAIAHRHDKPDVEEDINELGPVTQKRAFDVPELTHNLNLLVDMAEEDIIQNDRRLRYEKDHIVNMRHEKDRLDTLCDQEEKQLDKLRKVLDIVNMCQQRTQEGCEDPMSLSECAQVFRSLQNEYYDEYKMYDLSSLAIALVFPMMKKEFGDWDPLRAPQFGTATMKEWKYILEDYSQSYMSDPKNMDVYQKILWEIWLPFVRTTVLKWNARDCDPLIELLENWMPLLPHWIMENILNQLVIPRLLTEVENWNPLTDTMPIHAWLHPWLPLMGDKLEPLYAPIRHKLSNALVNWHPSDSSAKVILQPWLRVFKPGHTEAFLVKNILPKLGMCMQEFVINPHQQSLDPWHWVMAWKEHISVKHMATMLENSFFPKWLNVLCSWLSNMPNYEEITKWYLGWKSLFSEDLMSYPSVKDHFNKALGIMNRAVSGHFQPGAKENMAYFAHTERRQMAAEPLQHPPPPPSSSIPQDFASLKSATPGSSYPASFKELVEKKAEENNILFMPIVGKTYEAKQVYKYGKMLMYMDRNVIFVFEKNNWIPVSLNNLIDKALG